MKDTLAVLSGNANRSLAQDICKYLDVPLSAAIVDKFSEGEINVQINENVRGKDVFVVQPISQLVGNEVFLDIVWLMLHPFWNP